MSAQDKRTHSESQGEQTEDDQTEALNQKNKIYLSRSYLEPPTMSMLPPAVKKRVKALKKIQLSSFDIEAKFYEEIHQLEMKYLELYKPQYEKRTAIVNGKHEPTEEECDFESDKEEDDLANDVNNKLIINKDDPKQETECIYDKNVKGIPEFWLTIFKNVSLLQEMIEEHDVPILKHLEDITVTLTNNPMGFVLNFHFSPNEYFSNSVLTKEYEMKCSPDESAPFTFEGPEIIKCTGCTIDWAKGKNIVTKTVKKKQKHKGRGEVRTVTTTVRRESFFNFFSPPVVDPEAEFDEETQATLTADFEIGHYIRERLVPRAVLYYTGECLEEDDDYEEEEEEDGDEESDEDEDYDEEEGEENARKNKKGNSAKPDECKQQ